MKLFYSTTSPFARKVLIALKLLELENRVELVAADPFASPSELTKANPLSKIPALVLDDQSSLSDSSLILNYLDSLNPQITLHSQNENSWSKRQFTQLAEGVISAAVNIVMERKRPENYQYPSFIDRQINIIQDSLAVLEQDIRLVSQDKPSILEITLATALDYLDFRLPEINWRNDRQLLNDWHQTYARRPEMQATMPHV